MSNKYHNPQNQNHSIAKSEAKGSKQLIGSSRGSAEMAHPGKITWPSSAQIGPKGSEKSGNEPSKSPSMKPMFANTNRAGIRMPVDGRKTYPFSGVVDQSKSLMGKGPQPKGAGAPVMKKISQKHAHRLEKPGRLSR